MEKRFRIQKKSTEAILCLDPKTQTYFWESPEEIKRRGLIVETVVESLKDDSDEITDMLPDEDTFDDVAFVETNP